MEGEEEGLEEEVSGVGEVEKQDQPVSLSNG